MAEKKKIATKKALASFCEANNISVDIILDHVKTLYKDKYVLEEDMANIIIKALFKKFDEVTEKEIKECIKELAETNKLHNFDIEEIERQKKEDLLYTLLEKIDEDVKQGDVKLSSYPEYSEDLINYIRDAYGHWSVHNDDGTLSLGKLFNRFFSYWFYDHEMPPFHCYSEGKEDVLFTKSKRVFKSEDTISSNDEKKEEGGNCGCITTIIIVIILYFLLK